MSDEVKTNYEMELNRITERMPETMNKEDVQKIRDALRSFMQRHHLKQVDIAKKLNISDAVISQFLKGEYEHNIEVHLNKIVDLINTADRRSRVSRISGFAETTIALKIIETIELTRAFITQRKGAISVIIGDSGHGKSICLEQYAATKKNTVYLLLDTGMNSTRIFSELAEKIGCESYGSMSNVTRYIIDNLQNREIVILLDEASFLTVHQLNLLRTILIDKCRCPLVLSGNADLLKTIMQPKTRRGYESLDQLRSRLIRIVNLDTLAAGRDGGIYTADDIRKLYQRQGVRLMEDAVKTLQRIARNSQGGRLQTCTTIMDALYNSNLIKDGIVTGEKILKIIGKLSLPVNVYLPIATLEQTTQEEPAKEAASA